MTLTWTWQPQDGDMASDPPPDTVTIGYQRTLRINYAVGANATNYYSPMSSGSAQSSCSVTASFDNMSSLSGIGSANLTLQYQKVLLDGNNSPVQQTQDANYILETLPVSGGSVHKTFPMTWQIQANASMSASDTNLFTMIGGGYLGASGGATVDFLGYYFILDANLIGDTNRDGVITDKDILGKQVWSNTRGAIYLANYNADNGRQAPAGGSLPTGTFLPDTVYFNDTGAAEYENTKMGGDFTDIAPLLIKAMPAATFAVPNVKAFLKVPELEDIRAVHLYKNIAVNEPVFWGGPNETRTEVDITSLVNNETDVTLGIEGLYLKGMPLPLPIPYAPNSTFDGIIDFVLEIRQNNTIISSSKVEMKVAPWLMLPNTQPSTSVWALSLPAPDPYNNADFITGLAASHQLTTEPWNAATQDVWGSQWFQDHVEIGYMQRPGGSKVMSVFRLPYYRGPGVSQPTWTVLHLLSSAIGVFQLGVSLIPNNPKPSGDYGGNVELMPPIGSYKMGRIVVGDTISDPLFNFLNAQEVQYPIKISTSWLDVGHVDEAIAFGPTANQIITASPATAYNTLNDRSIIPNPSAAVFFATGTKAPVVVTVLTRGFRRDGVQLAGDFTNTTWNYIRIISGPCAGQVGHIIQRGNGFLLMDKVWNTGSQILDTNGGISPLRDVNGNITNPCMGMWAHGEACPVNNAGFWTGLPTAGSACVLVEGTQFWDTAGPDKVPAIVTVQELLADTNLRAFNDKVDAKMTTIQGQLAASVQDDGSFTFIPLPVLYVGNNNKFDDGRSAFAFTPGLSNVQFVGNSLYFPKQFAPGSTVGNDCFQNVVASRLIGTNSVFLDDWNLYHRDEGEVHCGTATIRNPFSFDWWNNLQ